MTGLSEKEKSKKTDSNRAIYANGILEEMTQNESLTLSHSARLVESSWERCVSEYKLNRERHKGPEVVTVTELKCAAEPFDLLTHVAKPEIENLAERLASLDYVIMLTDPNGMTLDVSGVKSPNATLHKLGVCAGAVWGEDYAGTNGIGTSLATGSPVTIHRTQHFFSYYANLTCTAAPIFNTNGDIIADLDASSVAELPHALQMIVLDMIITTTRRIERSYFLEQHRNHVIMRVDTDIARTKKNGGLLFALDDNGCIREVFKAYASDISLPPNDSLIGRPPSDILEINWQDAGILSEQSYVERIGIARMKDNGLPCFATLLAPKNRSTTRALVPQQSSPQQIAKVTTALRKSKLGCLGLDTLAGSDPVMKENVRRIRSFLGKRMPILLHGETGTGKEEFARSIHEAQENAKRPFVVIDCSSIPESLIESELFGYETGTFTGARREGRKGRIVEANGGTLFLDEIGDMPLALQTRLLRVLSQGEVVPLGAAKPTKVSFDIICASHRNLPAMIEEGKFRQDLYYRIAGLRLELPPLRERTDIEDIILASLAIEAEQLEIDTLPSLTPAAKNIMANHNWPGNMRELRLAVRYALACAEGAEIDIDALPQWLHHSDGRQHNRKFLDNEPNAQELISLLERNDWSISSTAIELNVSRQTLYRWLKKNDISRPD